MSFARALRCRECGREYPLTPSHVCEFCFGPLEVTYDYDAIKKSISRESISRGPESLWRYADLLPVDGERVDLQAGFTPLIKADRLVSYDLVMAVTNAALEHGIASVALATAPRP